MDGEWQPKHAAGSLYTITFSYHTSCYFLATVAQSFSLAVPIAKRYAVSDQAARLMEPGWGRWGIRHFTVR